MFVYILGQNDVYNLLNGIVIGVSNCIDSFILQPHHISVRDHCFNVDFVIYCSNRVMLCLST